MSKAASRQRGVTMLVVLVMLSVMLLGGMALARLTDVGTLASGNNAFREASLQVSEVGLNTAFQRIRDDLVDEDTDLAGWYFAVAQPTDAQGMPLVDFDAGAQIVVGNFTLHYVAERMCEGVLPVTEPLRQCLVRQVPQIESAAAGFEKPDPPTARQYRVTIRVTGPKDTQTWVQSLISRG